METPRRWKNSQGLEEGRKTRTRRMRGRRPPRWQTLTQQLSWTARCAPLADRYLPQKTSTPTRPCTSGRARSSPPCSRLAVLSASLSLCLCHCYWCWWGKFAIAPRSPVVALQQPVTTSQRRMGLTSHIEGELKTVSSVFTF